MLKLRRRLTILKMGPPSWPGRQFDEVFLLCSTVPPACGDVAAILKSSLGTGTNLDIAATDQIRPIATTTAIPIPVRICISLRRVVGHIGLTYFSGLL